MKDPPGTVPTTHPRRPPAHQSVSLRHCPPAPRRSKTALHPPQSTLQSSPNDPASNKANPPSSVSPKINNIQSSGESSDAGKWFENTNNAVQSHASFVDNDPPFILRNSSSSATPPEGQDPKSDPLHTQLINMPYRPGLTYFNTEGSSTEDFRSVIDDLTVANKRLKQKLRRYEKIYDAHLQDEKLFEIRFHGLPNHKRKELEETLRKFTADLDDSLSSDYPQTSYAPPLDHKQTASSPTSRFAESGYASMSASGQNSTSAPSGQASNRKMSKSALSRQQQNVQSYLHDIPAGLLPKHTAPMTEKSKKKLVVRRLEQIFSGKRSAPGNHPQPMQQEEVAQSAAMADRKAKEASGQRFYKEGLREARIMPVRSEDEDIVGHASPEALQKFRPTVAIYEQDAAGSHSPDQRPTRPLDLDPYRAQIPAENMKYIRHLGFTPPDMISGEAPEDGHGWLYLNLLINMAQLHTINVTPDFVKDAVDEYSSKFELSHDGRKIRWKGGTNMTRNSDSSSERLSGNFPYEVMAGSGSKLPRKRLQTEQSGSSKSIIDSERKARRMARAAKEKDQNKLAYTPIFFHKEESDADDDYNLDMVSSSNSPLHAQRRGDSSGFGSSAMRSSSSRKKREDGPIIFYNKAKFCTDLSGDRHSSSDANLGLYKSVTTQPIGAIPNKPLRTEQVSEIAETRGPLDNSPMDLDHKEGERSTPSEAEIGFSPEALKMDTGEDSPETMEFEASGLGGVQPDDNFAIKVRRSQVRVEGSAAATAQQRAKSRLYPNKILEVLKEQPSSEGESSSQPIIKEEIISAARKDLPSSTLPPASFLPFDSTSSGDVDSDLESDVSSGPSTSSSSNNGPTTALQLLNISPTYRTNYSPLDPASISPGEDEDSDSESVDLLATTRTLDQNTVHASECEYDAVLTDRLAEEIPAGSSAAAAAGGGSGFNSPTSMSMAVAGEDGESTKRPSNASGSGSAGRTKSLKRARTSDSLATALQPGKAQKLD
ncbi:hypothetical protein K469DRAFT_544991 [Zopfia rhizophila CBS 207.26]|uniref:Frequency clock protein n=1 Tax=Zopfia rhizophila CBS 207.26 TaxID=1314779 RepID=A0A6A6EWS9_9PEZI|nr:hypothetical protein K469DRAFT_544991 [Zopfia rhizophila CBS 207.26]